MSNTPQINLGPIDLVEPIDADKLFVPPTELVEPLVYVEPITIISAQASNDQETK